MRGARDDAQQATCRSRRARMASASTSDDGPREVIPDLFIGAINSAFTATALDALRISLPLNCTLDAADPEPLRRSPGALPVATTCTRRCTSIWKVPLHIWMRH